MSSRQGSCWRGFWPMNLRPISRQKVNCHLLAACPLFWMTVWKSSPPGLPKQMSQLLEHEVRLVWHFCLAGYFFAFTNSAYCKDCFFWLQMNSLFKYAQVLRAQPDSLDKRKKLRGTPQKQANRMNGSFPAPKQGNISSGALFWWRKRGPQVLAGCQSSDPHENTLLPKSHFWQSQPAFILPLNLS